jgi:hypothetical protein
LAWQALAAHIRADSDSGTLHRLADRLGLGKDQTSDESVPTSDAAEVPYTPEIPPPPPDPLEVDAVSDMLKGIMQDTRCVIADLTHLTHTRSIVHDPEEAYSLCLFACASTQLCTLLSVGN